MQPTCLNVTETVIVYECRMASIEFDGVTRNSMNTCISDVAEVSLPSEILMFLRLIIILEKLLGNSENVSKYCNGVYSCHMAL